VRPSRFEAGSLLDAVRRVREVLGPDAWVLSIRVQRRRGWLRRRDEHRVVVQALPAVARPAPSSGHREPSAGARDPTSEASGSPDRLERLEAGLAALARRVEFLAGPAEASGWTVSTGTAPAGPSVSRRAPRPASSPRSVRAWNRDSSSS